jgi:hypothetical protein
MRDIRSDLRERLEDVTARLEAENEAYSSERRRLEVEHAKKLDELAHRRNALLLLINGETEDEASGGDRAFPSLSETLSLKDFFLTKVRERATMNKEDLKDAAERAGYFKDCEAPGRVTHTTLLNLVSSRQLKITPDGFYAGPSYSSVFKADLGEWSGLKRPSSKENEPTSGSAAGSDAAEEGVSPPHPGIGSLEQP